MSDKAITQKSSFVDHIKYGDVVLVDCGFNIHDDLALLGAILEFSAFTKGPALKISGELSQEG